jgi:hypothetical protein
MFKVVKEYLDSEVRGSKEERNNSSSENIRSRDAAEVNKVDL